MEDMGKKALDVSIVDKAEKALYNQNNSYSSESSIFFHENHRSYKKQNRPSYENNLNN